jgi:lactobin A/cerein 7B family class IIb bacteriocin
MQTILADYSSQRSGLAVNPAAGLIPIDADAQIVELTEDELQEVNGAIIPAAIAIRVAGGAVIGGVMGGITSYNSPGGFSWKSVGIGALGGALSGGFAGGLKVLNL